MLAELAAANAAFNVIKSTISNGGEIAKAATSIAKFVGAKEDLERKSRKKGGGADLEEFMALEQIREKEEELKKIMIYLGRPGLWGDWQRFLAQARKDRREAEEVAKQKRKQIVEIIIGSVVGLAGLAVLLGFILLLLNIDGRL